MFRRTHVLLPIVTRAADRKKKGFTNCTKEQHFLFCLSHHTTRKPKGGIGENIMKTEVRRWPAFRVSVIAIAPKLAPRSCRMRFGIGANARERGCACGRPWPSPTRTRLPWPLTFKKVSLSALSAAGAFMSHGGAHFPNYSPNLGTCAYFMRLLPSTKARSQPATCSGKFCRNINLVSSSCLCITGNVPKVYAGAVCHLMFTFPPFLFLHKLALKERHHRAFCLSTAPFMLYYWWQSNESSAMLKGHWPGIVPN